MAIAYTIALSILAEVLILSAVAKFRSPADFSEALVAFRLFRTLSRRQAASLSVVIAGVEFVLGCTLLAGYAVSAAMGGTSVFLVGLAVVLMSDDREVVPHCGCNLVFSGTTTRRALVFRSFVLLAISAALLAAQPIASSSLLSDSRVIIASLSLPWAILGLELPTLLQVLSAHRQPLRMTRLELGG